MPQIPILIVRFKNPLESYEIPSFRGAIIQATSESGDNLLFHNHDGDKLRYAYPLIQYKTIQHKAAILCVKDGTEQIGNFFANNKGVINIQNRQLELEIDKITTTNYNIQLWDDTFYYRINNWQALNSDNYEKYQLLEGVVAKCAFLEKILIGNILSFLKGVGIHIENQLKCEITSLSDPKIIKVKNMKLNCFNIEFKTNISLPDYIGIGKHSSLGLGILTQKKYK